MAIMTTLPNMYIKVTADKENPINDDNSMSHRHNWQDTKITKIIKLINCQTISADNI